MEEQPPTVISVDRDDKLKTILELSNQVLEKEIKNLKLRQQINILLYESKK